MQTLFRHRKNESLTLNKPLKKKGMFIVEGALS